MQKGTRISPRARWALRAALIAGVVAGGSAGARAVFTNLALVRTLHAGRAEHLEQSELLTLVQNNQVEEAFETAFEHGDELFETVFNTVDGVGANVGGGRRFTRFPRADLTGPGEWATQVPARSTGPNAQACNTCHNLPGDDGAGAPAADAVRDPEHSGAIGRFIERNTPHLFGAGAVQRLAEEMTERLAAQRSAAIAAICAAPLGAIQSKSLSAKGVSFGSLRTRRVSRGGSPCPNTPRNQFTLDTGDVRGVDPDLVVRPFQWKGSVAFLRDFNRDAAHNELGMQPIELVGDGVDGDGDGIADELTIGDQTALAVYLSAQPRPVTTTELAALGLAPAQTPQQVTAIANGATQFRRASCDNCHKPALPLDDPVFSEPSQDSNYRDAVFPGGQNPRQRGVDPTVPITYDLTQDIPDNQIPFNGEVVHLGNHVANGKGGAIIALFGDLKRHDMGTGLAEPIDEVGTGRSMFLTENLWGVGSTAPYMHDGRATTLTEAILAHGGEASSARSAFTSFTTRDQSDLIAFLDNLVLFKQE